MKRHEIMSINSKPGDKIVFKNKNNGLDGERKRANDTLSYGETYTIKSIEVGGWRTDVVLEEFPERSFNSVFFVNKK